MSFNQIIVNSLKTLIFAIIVIILIVLIPYSIATPEDYTFTAAMGKFQYLGLVLIIFGIIGYLTCIWKFFFDARSSPIPGDIQEQLIVKGLYRYVRNPLYISAYLVLSGEAFFYQSWGVVYYLLGWGVFFTLFVIYFEEPQLREKFGDSYEQYFKSVPRWIPRLKVPKKNL